MEMKEKETRKQATANTTIIKLQMIIMTIFIITIMKEKEELNTSADIIILPLSHWKEHNYFY